MDNKQTRLLTCAGHTSDAKAVIQDVASYEEIQETLALLKILALGNKQVAQGRTRQFSHVVNRLRKQWVRDRCATKSC